ncbi:integrase core domain protein [Ancylostoma caninum]|uniref:RNA-directed DNA polymerase n=1 Tax=Ancylostoma caninum TaxID=29170 RepID=A0A368G5A2_ANCCA|nr:integrase core domain protein [Ancylostoma caninum]
MVLQEFDIVITYRPGKGNVVCDTLSRLPPDVNAIRSIDESPTNPHPSLCFESICKEQDECPWIVSYKDDLESEEPGPETANYIILNGILYKLPERLYQDPQIVLPENSKIKHELIKQVHESNFGTAHLGIQKTRADIAKLAIWNKMSTDIAEFVRSCPLCQLRKNPSVYRTSEPLDRFEIPKRPWQRLHSDVVGPLPQTLTGNRFIIVFVDAFSKFIIAEPIPDQKATTTEDIFGNRIVSRFGPPETLVTDQGTNYMSDIFRNTLKTLNVTRRTSTPYHHESNGQVERANRTIEELISIAVDQKNDQWDDVIHLMTHAYNFTDNTSTKYSPHLIVHGREPNNAFRLALQLPSKTFISEDDYVEQLISTLQNVWKDVEHNIATTQQTQKYHYDLRKRVTPTDFKTGQQVLIRKDVGPKIAPKFEGPFPIVDIERPNTTVKDGRRLRTIHFNRLKPYIPATEITSNEQE